MFLELTLQGHGSHEVLIGMLVNFIRKQMPESCPKPGRTQGAIPSSEQMY